MLEHSANRGPAAPAAGRSRGAHAGFTLLELVIVIGIISVLIFLAIQRLFDLRADAEAAAMESVLGGLRSAMGLEVAARVVRGGLSGVAALEGSNPMDRLAELPKNYVGALDHPDPAAIEGGQWYFDRTQGVLVYRVQFEEHFESGLPGPARARFKVRILYADNDGNGEYDQGVDDFEGVRIEALEPYRWLKEAAAEG